MEKLIFYLVDHTVVNRRNTNLTGILVGEYDVQPIGEPNEHILKHLLCLYVDAINPLDRFPHDLDELVEFMADVELAVRLIALGVHLGLWVQPMQLMIIAAHSQPDVGFAMQRQPKLAEFAGG